MLLKRDITGILLLDKPKGFSSNNILQKVKKIYYAKKAGHTGSLDPIATGMLPICFGEATKFAQYLINADKLYLVTAFLGIQTNTCDAYGKIIKKKLLDFGRKKLKQVIKSFEGNLLQTPSMFSALKYKGIPLYKYARKGIEIPRKKRKIIVYKIKLINWEKNILKLEIHCSKGTYIRTIIDDLGKKLGCGAHVIELRRLKVGNYNKMIDIKKINKIIEKKSFNIKKIDSFLLPICSFFDMYPKIQLSKKEIFSLQKGQTIKILDIILPGLVQITTGKKNKFIGIAEVDQEYQIIPRRLIQIDIN